MTRLEIAVQRLAGMCAGDWQVKIPEGKTWDDVVIPRALELADKMMEFETTGRFEQKEYPMTPGEQNDIA